LAFRPIKRMAFMQVFYMPMPAAPATAQVQTSDAIDANGRRPIYRLDVDAREDVVRKNGEFVEAGNEAQDAERMLDESKRDRAAASERKHGFHEEISLRGAQRSQLRSAYQRELDPA
jgi:hypothetical protein